MKSKQPKAEMPSQGDSSVSAKDRVRKHREALRARGLRPIQIWVPDTRSASFATEARRQSLAVNDPEHDKEVFEFMDAVLAGINWD